MFRILFAILIALTPVTASAHYVAWSDPELKFTMAFSDLWKDQGGLTGDARIKVTAPSGDASCTIFAKQDKRFTIYPRDYMLEVVAQEVQWDYWKQALSNSDELTFYYDNYGALGSGDARYTLVDYIDRNTGGEPVRKRALVFATIYGDLHMMTHCSAPIPKFRDHWMEFARIVDSVQFEQKYATTYRGDYRDFLETKQKGLHFHEKIVSFFWPRKTASAIVNCPRVGTFTPDYENMSATMAAWQKYYRNFEACLYKPKPPQIQTR